MATKTLKSSARKTLSAKGRKPDPCWRCGKNPKNHREQCPFKGGVIIPRKHVQTCSTCPGAASLVMHDRRAMTELDNGKWQCAGCGRKRTKPEQDSDDAEPEDLGTWYVLQVTPGSEAQVRADIMKTLRVKNLERRVRRIMSPGMLKEVVGIRAGEVLKSGIVAAAEWKPGRNRVDPYGPAKLAGLDAARRIFARRNKLKLAEVEPAPHYAGLKVSTFPAKGKAGFVEWKVREYQETNVVARTVKVRKYPGYLLVEMDYDEETAHVIKKTRNAWGVLLQPVVTGHNIKLSERKSQFAAPGQNLGWRWRVCEPDGGRCVAKGYAQSKPEALTAAQDAKAKAEEFKPTRLKDREAAEALIAQTAVNQILKDKEELNKAVCNLRVGNGVRVKVGVFRDCRGMVRNIVRDRTDRTIIKVDCILTILDRPVPATFDHYELERYAEEAPNYKAEESAWTGR